MVRVLACGNPMRQDDGVGEYLAGRITERWGSRVEVHVAHQLQWEWLEDVNDGDVLLFIDAATVGAEVELRPVEPKESDHPPGSHQLTPEEFCRMARDLYHLNVEGHVCSVRSESFDLGQGLTPVMNERASQALGQIEAFLKSKTSE